MEKLAKARATLTFATLCKIAAAAVVIAVAGCKTAPELSLWRDGTPAKAALLEYLEAVTDEGSPDFIPPAERVAVFDFDGTLFCETDPTYFDWLLFERRVLDDSSFHPTEEQRAAALASRNGVSIPGLTSDRERMMAAAYGGMTLKEFGAFVRAFMDEPHAGFSGLKQGEAFYRPMLEVVRLLAAREFRVYVCSGSDRLILREVVPPVIDLPPDRLIGSDSVMVARRQNGINGLYYTYQQDDELVLGGESVIKNLQMNKIPAIVKEIGVQPVLAFGNSFSDASMLNYTLSRNPRRAIGFMLLCDDVEREYGNLSKAGELRAACGKNGWVPVSMKDDWATIYGDGVKPTRRLKNRR